MCFATHVLEKEYGWHWAVALWHRIIGVWRAFRYKEHCGIEGGTELHGEHYNKEGTG